MQNREQTEELEEDWLEEKVAEVRKPVARRPDYQAAMQPCDACQ